MKTPVTSLVAAALLTFTSQAGVAQIVTNGNFEANASSFTDSPGYTSTVQPGNGNPSDASGWTTVSGGYAVNGPDTGVGNAFGPSQLSDPYDFVALFSSGAVISQNLTLAADTTYTLTFDAGSRSNENFPGYFGTDSGTVTIEDTLGNALVDAESFSPTAGDGYLAYSFTFTTPDVVGGIDSAVLEFATTGETSDSDGGQGTLDLANVAIEAPEPSTYALLGLGALLLVGINQRRFSRKV